MFFAAHIRFFCTSFWVFSSQKFKSDFIGALSGVSVLINCFAALRLFKSIFWKVNINGHSDKKAVLVVCYDSMWWGEVPCANKEGWWLVASGLSGRRGPRIKPIGVQLNTVLRAVAVFLPAARCRCLKVPGIFPHALLLLLFQHRNSHTKMVLKPVSFLLTQEEKVKKLVKTGSPCRVVHCELNFSENPKFYPMPSYNNNNIFTPRLKYYI